MTCRPQSVVARWSSLLLFVLLAIAAAPARAQQPKPLTVERIYSEPSLSGELTSGLQWSPDGKQLTYLRRIGQGDAAQHELWVLDTATGERRVLISADKLRQILPPAGPRGQQTGLGRVAPPRYLWASNGKALLFISPAQLFWYDLESQAVKKLVAEQAAAPRAGQPRLEDVKISPDSRWVSYVADHDLWAVCVEIGEKRQLTRGGREELLNAELDWVYPEELEIRTAYWWSPDSSQIAYLQLDERPVARYPLVNFLTYTGETSLERYPTAGDPNPIARLGVVSISGGETRWMDTGGDPSVYLARVAWLRDSKRLAIQRLNRAQNKLELLFADAADGHSEVVLTEQDPYWINLSDILYFFADGRRFLWSSERDAFRHLYLYDLGGKLLAQLTHGKWQVESVAGVDEKQGVAYFTSTEKSPLERHLYRVSLAGGEPVQLTQEKGAHGINMAPDFAHFVDTYSNATTPPRQDLCRADGTRQLAINDNKVTELAQYNLQPVEFFTVPGADGTPLYASMIKPPDSNPARKYPVIVHLYGGPHGQEVRNAWAGATFLWHQLMAQKGYIIFTLDNRGMAGRGHAFETPIFHHFGEAELADQLAGVAWLKRQSYVDGSRIGIWGWSFGGYMTCYAMLRAGEVFKVGFAGAPVTDWRQYDTIYTERYMGLPQDNPEGYKDSSPVNWAAGLLGKLLIAHATGDDNVHFANTVELAEKFVQAGHYAEYQIYAGRGHGISDRVARFHIFKRVTQLFLDNL